MSIVKTVINEYEDWKYQQFLRSHSGDTTVRMYNDLKYLIRDMGDNRDHISDSFKQTISNYYSLPVFVVDRLVDKADQYLKKKSEI